MHLTLFLPCVIMSAQNDIAQVSKMAQLRALHTYLKTALRSKYTSLGKAYIANMEAKGYRLTEPQKKAMREKAKMLSSAAVFDMEVAGLADGARRIAQEDALGTDIDLSAPPGEIAQLEADMKALGVPCPSESCGYSRAPGTVAIPSTSLARINVSSLSTNDDNNTRLNAVSNGLNASFGPGNSLGSSQTGVQIDQETYVTDMRGLWSQIKGPNFETLYSAVEQKYGSIPVAMKRLKEAQMQRTRWLAKTGQNGQNGQNGQDESCQDLLTHA